MSIIVFYPPQVLDLSNNDLKAFILMLPSLRELHLSGNKLLSLPPGWMFPNLQTLTIQVRTNLNISSCILQALGNAPNYSSGQTNVLHAGFK